MKVKRMSQTAILPTRGSEKAAGLDLYADLYSMDLPGPDELWIDPHQNRIVKTGIACEIPDGYCGLVFARSGLATMRALRPANAVGVIDSDYRGEIKVALHNDSDEIQMIEHNERIAQLVIVPCVLVDIEEVTELTSTERGERGFGSTGRGV